MFRAGEKVLRLSPPERDVSALIALTTALDREGIPVLRPLEDLGLVDGMRATVWEYVPPEEAPVDFEALGRAAARLHAIPPSRLTGVSPLPSFGAAEWLNLGANLTAAAATGLLDEESHDILRHRCRELRDWAVLPARVAVVVCHGDLHPANVLMRRGSPVIIDWDMVCLGPAAWDHAALMTWPERWGGRPGDYAAFARGYGGDLRDDPFARRLAEVRLLAPTINMVIRGAADPRCAVEARRRLRYWLGDPAAPQWTPL